MPEFSVVDVYVDGFHTVKREVSWWDRENSGWGMTGAPDRWWWIGYTGSPGSFFYPIVWVPDGQQDEAFNRIVDLLEFEEYRAGHRNWIYSSTVTPRGGVPALFVDGEVDDGEVAKAFLATLRRWNIEWLRPPNVRDHISTLSGWEFLAVDLEERYGNGAGGGVA